MTDIGLLLEMLTYRRPMGSGTETEFRRKYVYALADLDYVDLATDDNLNIHVWVSNADGSPSRVLWSCHTDTVHRTAGRQTTVYDPISGVVTLSRKARKKGSNCLGADDTAGVFLCVSMVRAQVPGHYVFHYGEERGGIGSSGLAREPENLLDDIQIAIALDRRGTSDVITHQFGWRSASDAFAQSLARALGTADNGLRYAPSHGIYTDTAEYTGLIPECTNLSVGYLNEHRSDELLMTKHTLRLLEALKILDTSSLVVERIADPFDYEETYTVNANARTYAPSDLCVYCGHSEDDHDTRDGDCCRCLCEVFVSEDDQKSVMLYLDPEYAEIQRSLSRAQDDLKRQTTRAIVLSWPNDDHDTFCQECCSNACKHVTGD